MTYDETVRRKQPIKSSPKETSLEHLAKITAREFAAVRKEMREGFFGMEKGMRKGFKEVGKSIRVLAGEVAEIKMYMEEQRHEERIRLLEGRVNRIERIVEQAQ